MSFDIVIKNGKIINGSGNPWYRADIGIKDGKIAKIARLLGGEEEIDAEGMIVSPGFIDMHNHSDVTLQFNNRLESMVHQGITTMVVGNCGISLAPVNRDSENTLRKYVAFLVPPGGELKLPWTSFEEYLREVDKERASTNLVFLVGHGTVRIAAMGFDNRDPTIDELEKMKAYVGEAMRAGAFGLSSGLIYPPGSYSKTSELIELVKIVAEYGGTYFSHIRGEGDTLFEAIKEAIQIGETGGTPVQIAHLKVAGRQNWGKSKEVLRLIEEANARGVHVTADQYPYTAGSTYLASIYPQWAHEGGIEALLDRLREPDSMSRLRIEMEAESDGWQNWVRDCGWEGIVISAVKTKKNTEIEGKSIAEIARLRDTDPFTAVADIMLDEAGEAQMILFAMDEEDVERIMRHRHTCVGSDGWAHAPYGILSSGKPHPRSYGTFPKVLGKYVRQDGVLVLQEAIRKMTSFQALKLGLLDRGLIREGFCADIVIFDPDTIIDQATFENPHKYPEGISKVIVNGEIVVDNNEHTGGLPGKILRHYQ